MKAPALKFPEFRLSARRNARAFQFNLCAVETCRSNGVCMAPDGKRLCETHSEEWNRWDECGADVGAFELGFTAQVECPGAEAFAIWCGLAARAAS